MERGDIYLVSLDPTAGHEQQGTRPVLVVSPAAFNRLTKTPVVLPITTGGSFARTAGFAVPLAGAGTKTTGVIRCDQPRALDLGARNGRRLESAPAADRGRGSGEAGAALRVKGRDRRRGAPARSAAAVSARFSRPNPQDSAPKAPNDPPRKPPQPHPHR